jgi:hypothetical protein
MMLLSMRVGIRVVRVGPGFEVVIKREEGG